MQPWAAEHYRAVREGISDPNQQGRDELDPVIASCAPVGMPRIMLYPRAFEIIQLPGRVLMLFEWDHLVRQISMSGQALPADPDPIWMGYSTGRWDGNTLVVDTVGLTDQATRCTSSNASGVCPPTGSRSTSRSMIRRPIPSRGRGRSAISGCRAGRSSSTSPARTRSCTAMPC
jgi:hypothetical protein